MMASRILRTVQNTIIFSAADVDCALICPSFDDWQGLLTDDLVRVMDVTDPTADRTMSQHRVLPYSQVAVTGKRSRVVQ